MKLSLYFYDDSLILFRVLHRMLFPFLLMLFHSNAGPNDGRSRPVVGVRSRRENARGTGHEAGERWEVPHTHAEHISIISRDQDMTGIHGSYVYTRGTGTARLRVQRESERRTRE